MSEKKSFFSAYGSTPQAPPPTGDAGGRWGGGLTPPLGCWVVPLFGRFQKKRERCVLESSKICPFSSFFLAFCTIWKVLVPSTLKKMAKDSEKHFFSFLRFQDNQDSEKHKENQRIYQHFFEPGFRKKIQIVAPPPKNMAHLRCLYIRISIFTKYDAVCIIACIFYGLHEVISIAVGGRLGWWQVYG